MRDEAALLYSLSVPWSSQTVWGFRQASTPTVIHFFYCLINSQFPTDVVCRFVKFVYSYIQALIVLHPLPHGTLIYAMWGNDQLMHHNILSHTLTQSLSAKTNSRDMAKKHLKYRSASPRGVNCCILKCWVILLNELQKSCISLLCFRALKVNDWSKDKTVLHLSLKVQRDISSSHETIDQRPAQSETHQSRENTAVWTSWPSSSASLPTSMMTALRPMLDTAKCRPNLYSRHRKWDKSIPTNYISKVKELPHCTCFKSHNEQINTSHFAACW